MSAVLFFLDQSRPGYYSKGKLGATSISLVQVAVDGVFCANACEFRTRASGSSAEGVSNPFTLNVSEGPANSEFEDHS
jgi:hypothetical protein